MHVQVDVDQPPLARARARSARSPRPSCRRAASSRVDLLELVGDARPAQSASRSGAAASCRRARSAGVGDQARRAGRRASRRRRARTAGRARRRRAAPRRRAGARRPGTAPAASARTSVPGAGAMPAEARTATSARASSLRPRELVGLGERDPLAQLAGAAGRSAASRARDQIVACQSSSSRQPRAARAGTVRSAARSSSAISAISQRAVVRSRAAPGARPRRRPADTR